MKLRQSWRHQTCMAAETRTKNECRGGKCDRQHRSHMYTCIYIYISICINANNQACNKQNIRKHHLLTWETCKMSVGTGTSIAVSLHPPPRIRIAPPPRIVVMCLFIYANTTLFCDMLPTTTAASTHLATPHHIYATE